MVAPYITKLHGPSMAEEQQMRTRVHHGLLRHSQEDGHRRGGHRQAPAGAAKPDGENGRPVSTVPGIPGDLKHEPELLGGLEHGFYFPFHIWDVILPLDFHIFQDG